MNSEEFGMILKDFWPWLLGAMAVGALGLYGLWYGAHLVLR